MFGIFNVAAVWLQIVSFQFHFIKILQSKSTKDYKRPYMYKKS